MENNKYLNEEKYQQNAKKLKTIGIIVLITGICMLILGAILLVTGFIGFGESGISTSDPTTAAKGAFSSFGVLTIGAFIDSTGFFITIIGGVILLIAHKREITAFSTQQIMPVAKEGINEMAPTIGNAAGEIAKGIKKGINEANQEQKKEE